MDGFRLCCLTLVTLMIIKTIHANTTVSSLPRMVPAESEYIINANDNFTLKCEGTRPVSWKLPNNTQYEETKPKYSTITVSSSETSDSEYIYASVLRIQNASYLDVGFYYCLENTANLDDTSKVSSLYLYVDDPEHLSVSTEYPDAIIASQFSEVTLPCRPTSPDVQVTLQNVVDEAQIVLDKPDSEAKIFTYDRRRGFTINQVNNDDIFLYECIFSRDNIQHRSLFVLAIQPLPDSIAKPTFEEISDGHAVIGEKLQLRCKMTMDTLDVFLMKWIIPDQNGVSSGRIQISRTTVLISENIFYQDLTINETTTKDQGNYECIVKYFNITNSISKIVSLYSKPINTN